MDESRRHPPLSHRHFLRRLAVHGALLFALVVISLALGMIGYRSTEHLGWLDAFLNSAWDVAGTA